MDEPRPQPDQPDQPDGDTQRFLAYGAPTPPPPPPGTPGSDAGRPQDLPQDFPQGHQQGYQPGYQQGYQQVPGYGPGTPYQGYGQPPYLPYGGYPPPQPTHRRRRGPVVAAVGTAVAVVLAAGIGGFALGRVHHGNDAAGGPPGLYGNGQAPDGQNGQGGQGDYGDLDPFGNFGAPFTGGQGGQTGTAATSDQLTGLVRVSTTLGYQNGAAAGTGMILTSDGEVVTNHHVVEGATEVTVTVMTSGRQYDAEVVGTDAKDDVAVLQLQGASGLDTVTTDTDGISVGDAVTAVGDAGGSATTFTAAAGKVTATDQHITTHDSDGSMGEKLSGLIEISSDVISGDSGGATYDDQGQVVGMTTAASTGSSDIVGYAIPVDTVLRIADDLEGHVQNARYAYGAPAFLGLGLSGEGTEVAGSYPGTPAAKAGIDAGATITEIDGTHVSTAAGLKRAIQTYAPGDRVEITWTDAQGTRHTATVTLVKGPIA